MFSIVWSVWFLVLVTLAVRLVLGAGPSARALAMGRAPCGGVRGGGGHGGAPPVLRGWLRETGVWNLPCGEAM